MLIQCESENFTPVKLFELYYLKPENFEAMFYTNIWRLNLCQTAKFHLIILKFDEVMLYYVCYPKRL